MLLIQKVIRLFGGYVKVRVEGYSAERFLNLCSYRQIDVWGLVSRQNSYEMYMTLKGFRRIRPIVHKTHTKVLLIKRYGLPFFSSSEQVSRGICRRRASMHRTVVFLFRLYLGHPF